MRKLFLCLIIIAALYGCNTADVNSKGSANDGSTTTDTTGRKIILIEPVKGTTADIPSTIKVSGTIQEVWKWKDKMGDNLLITSSVAPFKDKNSNEYGEEGYTGELYAAHYTGVNGDYRSVWTIKEAEKSCPFDITCEFIKNSVSITDLDADSVAEITLQYKLACRSDVSPAFMKLVMYEEGNKYGLEGLMWLAAGPEDKFTVTENNANLENLPGYKGTEEEYLKTFGRYETEKEFAKAPDEFIRYARSRWMQFVKESFD
jgi:hypothetical protein